MEIINIAGYTPNEKLQIAKKYLLKRAIDNHGLADYPVHLTDKIFMRVIRGYTREAGVRGLERQFNTVARKIATDVVTKDIAKGKKFSITSKQITKFLTATVLEDLWLM